MTQALSIEDFGATPKTTLEVLDLAASLASDIEAVVAGDLRVTFGELQESVHKMRKRLAAEGVQKGDYVALCMGNGVPWIEFFYALTSLGAVVVPINTRLRAEEVAFQLRQARVQYVFAASRVLSTDFIEILSDICPQLNPTLEDQMLPALERIYFIDGRCPTGAYNWQEIHASSDAVQLAEPSQDVDPQDPALVQFTSGTTSAPKGALLRHGSICLNALVSSRRMGLRQGDRYFSARPFFHVAGSTLSVLSSAQAMCTLVSLERFQPQDALYLMERERCTHFSGNDTIAQMLLNEPAISDVSLSLRGAWLAASAPTIRRVIQEMDCPEVVVGYGLSEASPNVAQSAWYEPEDIRVHGWLKPQPGVLVRIVDPQSNQEVGFGVQGEVQVLGWNVMTEYLHDAERTAETFTPDGWLKTGDLGMQRADGRLRFTGRLKEIIRVGGENVSPAEIEDVLITHPQIAQAAVVGVPDDRLVEVPFAFLVLQDPSSLSRDEIQQWCKKKMAGFKMPKYFVFVDDFKNFGMTASSKIQKSELTKVALAWLAGEKL